MIVSVAEVSAAQRMRVTLADERLRDALRAIVSDMLDQGLDDVSADVRGRLSDLINDLVKPAAGVALDHLACDFNAVLGSSDKAFVDWLDRRWRLSVLGIE